MLYKFSKLISSLRTQAQFDQWVESRKAEIKEKAYDKRHVIDKRSLQHELDSFDSLKKAYKPLKKLRRKSGDYDAAIVIDDKGYTSFRVYFPVSQEELDAFVNSSRGASDYKAMAQRITESMHRYCQNELWKFVKEIIKAFAQGGFDDRNKTAHRQAGDVLEFMKTSKNF